MDVVTLLIARWSALGWIGKLLSLALILYGCGWIVGNLGANAMARQLGSAALFVFALLLTGLFIRLIWRNFTAPARR